MGLPSPSAVAMLTILNINRYSDEIGKKATRFRMSRAAFGKLAKRQLLRSAFLSEYEEHLSGLGWIMFELPDANYAFLEASSVDGWTKISAKRVFKEVNGVSRGTISEDELEVILDINNDPYDLNEE